MAMTYSDPPFWTEPRRDAVWIGAISFFFAILLILQALGPLKGLTGDEPHYLVVAHSLVSDGDLDLRDDYVLEQAWRSFYGGAELSPHYAPGLAGHYSSRMVGLAAYLVPFYWLGIAAGDVIFWTRLAIALLWVALVVSVYLLCRDLGLPRDVSVAAWLFGTFSVPLAFYSYSIYPEVPAALLAVLSLRTMLRWDGRGVRAPLLAGLCLALMPWLGIKFGAIALVAAVAYFILILRKRAPLLRSGGALLAAPVASAVLFAAFLLVIYGTINPTAIYTGVGEGAKQLASINRQAIRGGAFPIGDYIRTALMYFFDQRDGILFYSPVYIFGIVGLLLAIASKSRAAGLMASLFAIHWVSYTISGWSSGHAPAGRPLVAVIWVLIVGMAITYEQMRGRLANAIRVLTSTVTLAFFVILVTNNYLVYHVLLSHTASQGNNFFASIPGSVDLTQFFPNLFNPADIHPLPTILFIALAVTAVLVLFRIGRRPQPGAASTPGPIMLVFCGGLPLVLFGVAFLSAELVAEEEFRGKGEVRVAFRDGNTFGFEPAGEERPVAFWVRGGRSAAVDVVSAERPRLLRIDLHSRIPQTVELDVEGALFRVEFEKPRWQKVEVPGGMAVGWMGRFLFRLRVRSPAGFRPADHGGEDLRFLGCRVAVSILSAD